MNYSDIVAPTLLIDEDKCKANIKKMAQKANRFGLKFKPHFKTHQSAKIGTWFKEENVRAITVSSIEMAQYFASNGWRDITIAFPVNTRAIDQINDLNERINLCILANNMQCLHILEQKLNSKIQVYIEIDTGDRRTGIDTFDIEYIEKMSKYILDSSKMSFSGFYSHPGHSYSCRGETEVKSLHQQVLGKIRILKDQFFMDSNSYSVCIGDTPCCSLAEDFDGINEISPGNFVFYDLMQAQIGSCTINDIATLLVCPVVAKFDSRNEIAIHGGAVHLSKEFLIDGNNKNYGAPIMIKESGWAEPDKESHVKSLSQEHGIISCSDNLFNQLSIGNLIGILPVHSCLTANLMKSFFSISENRVNKLA